jgi:hypothetical protein
MVANTIDGSSISPHVAKDNQRFEAQNVEKTFGKPASAETEKIADQFALQWYEEECKTKLEPPITTEKVKRLAEEIAVSFPFNQADYGEHTFDQLVRNESALKNYLFNESSEVKQGSEKLSITEKQLLLVKGEREELSNLLENDTVTLEISDKVTKKEQLRSLNTEYFRLMGEVKSLSQEKKSREEGTNKKKTEYAEVRDCKLPALVFVSIVENLAQKFNIPDLKCSYWRTGLSGHIDVILDIPQPAEGTERYQIGFVASGLNDNHDYQDAGSRYTWTKVEPGSTVEKTLNYKGYIPTDWEGMKLLDEGFLKIVGGLIEEESPKEYKDRAAKEKYVKRLRANS